MQPPFGMADEEAIDLPLSLKTDCILADTVQCCASSEELCLSNALMEGRCLIVWSDLLLFLTSAQEDCS